MPTDPVLAAITRAAAGATAASRGWLLAAGPSSLEVVAAVGAGTEALVGRSVAPGVGSAGYVVASGQPLALAPRGADPRLAEGVGALLDLRPTSVLCVPCATDESVAGALELVDKAGGGAFSIDDVELAMLLADVAAVALGSARASGPSIPLPAELGGELARLAAVNPVRYAAVAGTVAALLAHE